MNSKIWTAIGATLFVAHCAAADIPLGFGDAFPKKFYESKYFGAAITATTVVAAGTFTYFTAGAGAPSAAAGVSSVASWVGGGGVGSYMAGLSTIGGAFGGNAMLGAAVLNGISIGTVGGGAAFSTLPASGKAMVMLSVSATTMDGVAVLSNPETKALEYKVILATPKKIGSKALNQLADDLRKLTATERELGAKLDKLAATSPEENARGQNGQPPSSEKFKAIEEKIRGTKEDRNRLELRVIALAENAGKTKESSAELVLLAVLSKNLGRSDLFEKLIKKVQIAPGIDSGYVDYLQAVAKVQQNRLNDAADLLRRSWDKNSYAIEQPILLVNILGKQGFAVNQDEILEIVNRTESQFNSEKYATPFSLVSLYYRVGAFALLNKEFKLAESQFEKAHGKRTLWRKYVSKDEFDNMIEIGWANALYGQGRKEESLERLEKILKRAKNAEAKKLVCAQFMGQCAS